MTKFKDLSGLKINKILVLSISRTDNTKKRKIIYYTCQCDCGNIFESNGYSIVRGNTKSCGCIKIKYNPEIGQEFNRLVIVSEKYKNPRIWKRTFKVGVNPGAIVYERKDLIKKDENADLV